MHIWDSVQTHGRGKKKKHFGVVDVLASSCSTFASCRIGWKMEYWLKKYSSSKRDSGRCFRVNHLKAWQRHHHLRTIRCQDRQIAELASFIDFSPTFWCVICSDVLAQESLKPVKVKRHLETKHSTTDKPIEFSKHQLRLRLFATVVKWDQITKFHTEALSW